MALTMGQAFHGPTAHDYWEKLVKGVRNNNREVLGYLKLDGTKDVLYQILGKLEPLKRMEIDRRLFADWLNPWAAKQGYALWYHHTGEILDENARVYVRWILNDSISCGTSFIRIS